MQSSGEGRAASRTALFIALAALLQAAETLAASPVPWLRLGLGNAFVLAVLVLYGRGPGFSVAMGKVLLGALITGKLFSPGFFLSLGGTLASFSVMALLAGLPFGFLGMSAAGAAAHAVTELYIARHMLSAPMVMDLLPVAGPVAVAMGVLTGAAAWWLAGVVLKEDSVQKETEGL